MSRRSGRRAASKRSQAAMSPVQVTPMEDTLQNLKILDIQRRTIQSSTRKVPFLHLLSIPLILSVLIVSLVGILISGAVYYSSLWGPIGAYKRRRDAREILTDIVSRLTRRLGERDPLANVRLMGFTGLNKRTPKFTEVSIPLGSAALAQLNEDGVFPDLGKYKHLVVVPHTEKEGFQFETFKTQYWYQDSIRKGASEEAIRTAVVEALK